MTAETVVPAMVVQMVRRTTTETVLSLANEVGEPSWLLKKLNVIGLCDCNVHFRLIKVHVSLLLNLRSELRTIGFDDSLFNGDVPE